MPEINLTTRLSNIGLLLLIFYLLSGICRAAFYDVSWRDFFNAFPGHWVDSIKRTGTALLAAFVILLTRNRS